MKEIEAKILEIDQADVEAKLKSLGAELEFEKEYFAIYYDTPGRELRSQGKVIRLRKEGEKAVLTFKEKAEGSGGIKVMEEHESGVKEFDAMRNIMAGLNYEPTLSMRKTRWQYQFQGSHIVIDQMLDTHSYIPVFMEIEAGSLEAVREIAGLFGFGPERLSDMSVGDLAEYYR